ncbi:hypothetical protein VNO77_19875 [Canavalia gladiata]|uniref:Protein kinase domain-containing protein n=1 Tax=Canavalia gladiata TaxID=3824 RepID=A0AAN9LNA8_CANGL
MTRNCDPGNARGRGAIIASRQRTAMSARAEADDERESAWRRGPNKHLPFNQVVSDLLGSLGNRAATGDFHRKFAVANKTGPSFLTVFAHVQCTPDLSGLKCTQFLFGAISYIPNCWANKIRARIFKPSCNLRFDTIPYYDPMIDVPPSLTPHFLLLLHPPQPHSKKVPIILYFMLLIFLATSQLTDKKEQIMANCHCHNYANCLLYNTTHLYMYYLRGKKPRKYLEIDDEIEPTETLQLDFQTIIDATNNFSKANKLGQGGFGLVYKGRLPNGEEVAIKWLSRDSGQGDIEFKNELLIVAKLQHQNLVWLLGFRLETGERILVTL